MNVGTVVFGCVYVLGFYLRACSSVSKSFKAGR